MKFIFKLFLITLLVSLSGCSTISNVFATPTLNEVQVLSTGLKYMQDAATANPDSGLHEFMQQYNVTLTAKQVQYDMANNLDKQFGLAGDAALCDYYNWGYDTNLKANFFCVQVTPSGGYLEAWYIYIDRKGGAKLFQALITNTHTYLMVIAKIESSLYDKNQQNQATGIDIKWSK